MSLCLMTLYKAVTKRLRVFKKIVNPLSLRPRSPWLLALGGSGGVGLLALEARDLGKDLLHRQTNTYDITHMR
jgi:NADPH:quinone reductase-like Zn-dependent oxidoreductase